MCIRHYFCEDFVVLFNKEFVSKSIYQCEGKIFWNERFNQILSNRRNRSCIVN